jgi:hypothetical protein
MTWENLPNKIRVEKVEDSKRPNEGKVERVEESKGS